MLFILLFNMVLTFAGFPGRKPYSKSDQLFHSGHPYLQTPIFNSCSNSVRTLPFASESCCFVYESSCYYKDRDVHKQDMVFAFFDLPMPQSKIELCHQSGYNFQICGRNPEVYIKIKVTELYFLYFCFLYGTRWF